MTATYFTCRSCGGKNASTFIDLGLSPLANSFVAMQDADTTDAQYPLHARVCDQCFLVQVDDVVPAADIFDHNYAYFSSFSDRFLGKTTNPITIELYLTEAGYWMNCGNGRQLAVLSVESQLGGKINI